MTLLLYGVAFAETWRVLDVASKLAIVDGCAAVQVGLSTTLLSDADSTTYASVYDFLSVRPVAHLVILGDATPMSVHLLANHGYSVCLYTHETRHLYLAQCVFAGANGVDAKNDSVGTLEEAIGANLKGER